MSALPAAPSSARLCRCGQPLPAGHPKHCSKRCGNDAYNERHRLERACEMCGALLPPRRHRALRPELAKET